MTGDYLQMYMKGRNSCLLFHTGVTALDLEKMLGIIL